MVHSRHHVRMVILQSHFIHISKYSLHRAFIPFRQYLLYSLHFYLFECVQISIRVSCCVKMCFAACASVKVFPVPYGPTSNMTGNLNRTSDVMATIASLCLAFSRTSCFSSHCLQQRKMNF